MEVDSNAVDDNAPRLPSAAAEAVSRFGDAPGESPHVRFKLDEFAASGDVAMAGAEASAGPASAAPGSSAPAAGAAADELYTSRDAAAKVEEDSGALQFRVVRNDGQRHNMIWLMQVKNLFGTQLPKMPREYIARLVLDRKHRSLLAIKNDRVVGGICFRPFVPQRFAEIAFLAVTSSEQIKARERAHGRGGDVGAPHIAPALPASSSRATARA